MSLDVEPLFPVYHCDFNINLLLPYFFHGENICLVGYILGITHYFHGAIFFISTITMYFICSLIIH